MFMTPDEAIGGTRGPPQALIRSSRLAGSRERAAYTYHRYSSYCCGTCSNRLPLLEGTYDTFLD